MVLRHLQPFANVRDQSELVPVRAYRVRIFPIVVFPPVAGAEIDQKFSFEFRILGNGHYIFLVFFVKYPMSVPHKIDRLHCLQSSL